MLLYKHQNLLVISSRCDCIIHVDQISFICGALTAVRILEGKMHVPTALRHGELTALQINLWKWNAADLRFSLVRETRFAEECIPLALLNSLLLVPV